MHRDPYFLVFLQRQRLSGFENPVLVYRFDRKWHGAISPGGGPVDTRPLYATGRAGSLRTKGRSRTRSAETLFFYRHYEPDDLITWADHVKTRKFLDERGVLEADAFEALL